MGIFSKHDNVGTTENGIQIESLRNDMPEFFRVYTVQIVGVDRHCTMKLTIGEWSLGLRKNAELAQDNGRLVIFDPDNIAEKILDRALVPLIQQYIDAIYDIDKAFRKSSPNQFIDERGITWRRVEG